MCEKEQEKLLQLCESLQESGVDDVILKLTAHIHEQVQCELALIFLRDSINQVSCGQVFSDEGNQALVLPEHSELYKAVIAGAICRDISEADSRLLEATCKRRITHFLGLPMTLKSGKVLGAVCMLNKRAGFVERDERSVRLCLRYTLATVENVTKLEEEHYLKIQATNFLKIAQNIFTMIDDVAVLLKEIMETARDLTGAERCSLFLVDKVTNELRAKVFDGKKASDTEIRIPINRGIAGYVATSGEALNIDDAYEHPLFYKTMDLATGFRTRNILCFPIKNEHKEVVGVTQLCNKKNGPRFTAKDMQLSFDFSVFCGISIAHSLLYEKAMDLQHKNRLANELMVYHMSQDLTNEIEKQLKRLISPIITLHPDLDKFYFASRFYPEDKTTEATLSMFQDMGLTSLCNTNKETLIRFCVTVRCGYRDNPYHNWSHAFSAAHFCYLMYKNTKGLYVLDKLELLSLFVSCLCHDIDHRGTTNSFQTTTKSILASLYSSQGSVLERHHFAQTMCILGTSGCNIFERLQPNDYEIVLDLVKQNILATDLAHHFEIQDEIKRMVTTGYNRENMEHHKILRCLFMTACDLNDSAKLWDCTQKCSEMLYQEFFKQGDLEKSMGADPIDLMDREKSADIPLQQINFLNQVVIPVFQMLTAVLPDCKKSLEHVKDNMDKWQGAYEQSRQSKPAHGLDGPLGKYERVITDIDEID